MTDHSQGKIEFNCDSPEARRIIEEACSRLGIRFRAERLTIKELHFHIYQGGEMGDQYVDRSEGPTGAKAFGRESSATNHGPVGGTFAADDRREVAAQLETLATLLESVQCASQDQVRRVTEEARALGSLVGTGEPARSAFAARWETVRDWIGSALKVGLFGATAAESVKEIVERVEAILTCAS